MPVLDTARSEPQSIRRGFEWRYRVQLYVTDADGNKVAQSLSGFTLTPGLRLTESKDGVTAGITISTATVSSESGIFDVVIAQADTSNLVVGKKYWWYVYGSHATVTSGKDELLRIGLVQVVA